MKISSREKTNNVNRNRAFIAKTIWITIRKIVAKNGKIVIDDIGKQFASSLLCLRKRWYYLLQCN